MEIFGGIIVILAILAFIVGIIALIISAIRKKNTKKWAFTLLGSAVAFIVGIAIAGSAANSSTDSSSSKDSSSKVSKSSSKSDDSDTSYDDDDSSSESSDSTSDDSASSSSSTFNAADYSTAYTYDQLARTPDQYKDKKVAFTGQVAQVVEGDDEDDLRVEINGTIDDTVLVGFDPDILNGSHILEGDKITFYGTSQGTTSYKSTLGQKITIPAILADKIVDSGTAPDDYEN